MDEMRYAILFPIGMITIVFAMGFSYGNDVTESSIQKIKTMSPDEWSCEQIENKIKFLDENRVMGYDTNKVIREFDIKSAQKECGV